MATQIQHPVINLSKHNMESCEVKNSELKLPEIKGIYEGKYKDRSPFIRSAGKLTTTGETTYSCMKAATEPRPPSPEIIKRFRNYVKPNYGKRSIHYGQAYDPELKLAEDMRHGVTSKQSHGAIQLLNPKPITRFRQSKIDKMESIYESHIRKPLGTCRNPENSFPAGFKYDQFVFGVPSEEATGAKECLNPSKNYEQVENEYDDNRDLYKKTHKAYLSGEQKHRNYIAPPFDEYFKYGNPTPHDNTGKGASKSLRWIANDCGTKVTPVVQKRLDDFRERSQPQLGTVLDPIKDTLNVPDDHCFGILYKPDEYGVGDLLHGRAPKHYLRGEDRERGLIGAIRCHLKHSNYQNFNSLVEAFKHYDKDGKGFITAMDLKTVCEQFQLPVDVELLVQLLDYCDVNREGCINYNEFANFLNWKDTLPSGLQDRSGENLPERLQNQIDKAIVDQKTSSQMINAVVGGVSTNNFRSFGCPSIRSDIPAPKVRKCDDKVNYGDEGNAHALLNPSIFTNNGVYEKDMLMSRSRNELRDIFMNIGLKISMDDFDKIYDFVAERQDGVSIESIRNVLDNFQVIDWQEKEKENQLTSNQKPEDDEKIRKKVTICA